MGSGPQFIIVRLAFEQRLEKSESTWWNYPGLCRVKKCWECREDMIVYAFICFSPYYTVRKRLHNHKYPLMGNRLLWLIRKRREIETHKSPCWCWPRQKAGLELFYLIFTWKEGGVRRLTEQHSASNAACLAWATRNKWKGREQILKSSDVRELNHIKEMDHRSKSNIPFPQRTVFLVCCL